MRWKSIFKRNFTSSKSEFSLTQTDCYSKVEKLSLPYNWQIAGGRIFGFRPFPKVLAVCEMQTEFDLVSPCLSPTTGTIRPRTSIRLIYEFVGWFIACQHLWGYVIPMPIFSNNRETMKENWWFCHLVFLLANSAISSFLLSSSLMIRMI